MAVLSVRNFDASLLQKLKVEAARRGETLREYVMSLLHEAMDRVGV
jgi:plasmid stability protein